MIGDGIGTYPMVGAGDVGSFSEFMDTTTFSELEATFVSTSGSLSVTRWDEADVPGPSSWYVDGSFDVAYSNDLPENPNPPINLEVVGEFANVLLSPLPE